MMIKIDFLLNLPEGAGFPDPFDKAPFVKEKIRMHDSDKGIKKLHPGREGTLENKTQVGSFLKGIGVTNRFLEG